MNKILKPVNFLFLLLNVVIAFILGMALGGIILDDTNLGFEGGAIIFNYGLVSALITLILSVVLIYQLKKEIIAKINVVGLIVLGFSIAFVANKANDRNRPIEQQEKVDQSIKLIKSKENK